MACFCQCVCKSALAKPDKVLRYFHLEEVVKASQNVSKVLLFHPHPFRHLVQRMRCFCGKLPNNKMLLCEECMEWFHLDCVGLTEQEAQLEKTWHCGYCRTQPDRDGNRKWGLAIPQGKRKRAKVAPFRNDSKMPKALGISADDNQILEGPVDWDDFVRLAKDGARKINECEMKYKKQAERLMQEGGHHIVDEVGLGGVQARVVDSTLVDDFLGQGLLEVDEGGDFSEVEDNDNV